MKKLLALALALFLLPAVAFSEDVTDLEAFFDSCTFEELMNLNRVVQLYLFKKAALSDPNGVQVPPGTYTVGTDFPAGTYRIEFQNKTGFEVCGVGVYDDSGSPVYDCVLGYGSADSIGKIELKYGYSVVLYYGTATFFPYTGLFH